MQNQLTQIDNRTKVIIGFILLGAISRLIPHPGNFTPIAAMALFGGTFIRNKRLAFLIPISALFISDILLQLVSKTGFHDQMLWVYGSMLIITCLGFLLRGREQRATIMVASLTGSVIFFLITNFGTWAAGYYDYTVAGLTNCYVLGIPFFRWTILGDLFYNLVFFGGFALFRLFYPGLSQKRA